MSKRKYKEYTDEDIIQYSSEVKSMSGLLRKLGLKVAGGNYVHMKKRLKELGLSCEHWTGQLWSKGERLKNWEDYTSIVNAKKHLINLKDNKCESCNKKEWLKENIPLEIHHIDGDRTNNNYENLQLLCCNCHALTKNWRGRNNT